jgi:hypothetical protein
VPVGLTPRDKIGAEVGPIPNPRRSDDAPVLLPRTGESRPPAAPAALPRRPLSADGAAVYGYLSHFLELRRNSLTVVAANDVEPLPSPPKMPPNSPSLGERKSPSSRPATTTSRPQNFSLISTNYKGEVV